MSKHTISNLNNYLFPIPEKKQIIIQILAAEMGPEWTDEQIKEVGVVLTNIYKNNLSKIQVMIQTEFDEYVKIKKIKDS